MSRNKGRRGEQEATHALTDRDWEIVELGAGRGQEDKIVCDPNGQRWSLEVKNCKLLKWADWEKQAREQAKARKLPWMLMARLPGYAGTWIVARQGERPAVWG